MTLKRDLVIVVVLLSLFLSVIDGGFVYSRCDDDQAASEKHFKIHNVTVEPWPPQVNEMLHVVAVVDFLTKVDEGSVVHVDVKVEGIDLLKKDLDPCHSLDTFHCPRGPNEENARLEYKAKLPDLPIEGNFDIKVSFEFFQVSPTSNSYQFQSQVDVRDQTKAQLFCIQFQAEINSFIGEGSVDIQIE